MGVNATETTAELAGRIAADAVTTVYGVGNMISGATIATGGSAVVGGATLGLGAVATVTAGATLATVGVAQTVQGAMGLGGNLALLSGSTQGGAKTDYGKLGKVTSEPNIGINQLNDHALEKHNVTRQMVDSWSQVSKKLIFEQNGGQRYLFVTAEGAYVVDQSGRVVTAYSVKEYTPELIQIAIDHGILSK